MSDEKWRGVLIPVTSPCSTKGCQYAEVDAALLAAREERDVARLELRILQEESERYVKAAEASLSRLREQHDQMLKALKVLRAEFEDTTLPLGGFATGIELMHKALANAEPAAVVPPVDPLCLCEHPQSYHKDLGAGYFGCKSTWCECRAFKPDDADAR